MSRFPGVGQRVRQRLRALGYWKDGRPDVGRFCSERDYRPQYLYAWLGDRIPTYDNLARLARDLEVPPEWVMFGTGSPTRRDALDAVDATRGPRRGAPPVPRRAVSRVDGVRAGRKALRGAAPPPPRGERCPAAAPHDRARYHRANASGGSRDRPRARRPRAGRHPRPGGGDRARRDRRAAPLPRRPRLFLRARPNLRQPPLRGHRRRADRKSTRLNSSHLVISYAVFCLKKKKHE